MRYIDYRRRRQPAPGIERELESVGSALARGVVINRLPAAGSLELAELLARRLRDRRYLHAVPEASAVEDLPDAGEDDGDEVWSYLRTTGARRVG